MIQFRGMQLHTYTYISYIKIYEILVSLLINKRWKGWIIQRGPVFMCILNALRRCHGELFLGRRAAVCLPRPLPPIQPGAYLIQHVIGSCVRLPKRQNPRTAEAAFEPKITSWPTSIMVESEGYFGRVPGATSRRLTVGEFVVTGRDEPQCFECCPLTLRHALSFPGEIPIW